MPTQTEKAQELIDAFGFFENWEDRYEYLMDLGRRLPKMDDADKIEDNRVIGCQSNVWVKANTVETPDGKVLEFQADSDARITKGLVAVLWSVYSGHTPQEILKFDIVGLLNHLELEQHLSPTRRNGLFGMIQRIKGLASTSLA